jgi:hypothetical protein
VHECAGFAEVAFGLCRLHGNAFPVPSENLPSHTFTIRLSLALFSPLQSKLFRPFLLFFVASTFASDTFAFVGNVVTTN